MTTRGARRSRSRPWGHWLAVLLVLTAAAVGLYAVHLDLVIRARFEGQRWALPARVYARPLELYAGAPLGQRTVVEALERLGYRQRDDLGAPATYALTRTGLRLRTRGYAFPDTVEPPRAAAVQFAGESVATLVGPQGAEPLLRLEPELIGGFFPTTLEDRLLVRLADVPPLLVQALLLLEDRRFYAHHGVSPRAIVRALFADVRAGRVVQGGSTITQQLVKNFFLTADRTMWRKFTEALMALMLEVHYGKDEILEAYLNEVFLGQVGRHSVHGIAQGSLLYFGRPLEELEAGELALLAGLVRAPSYYDPRRHPQRARARRDQVLALLAEHGVLSVERAAAEARRPVHTVPAPKALTRYPAFLDLVRRQLVRDYPDTVLRHEGLRIYSTLDPVTQAAAERALASTVDTLSRQRADPALQGALVVAEIATGEVLAVVGGRDPAVSGFNRALDAARQVGSLAKPAVYLAALSQPQRFHYARQLEDRPLTVPLSGGRRWQPANADKSYFGEVSLFTALVASRNVPTVGLGLEVGLPAVVRTLRALGVERPVPEQPAILLGAFELTPLEVTQVYLSLASGGFRTPPRSIQAVADRDGKPLGRYPLRTQAAADPAAVYLVNVALTEVTRSGTGHALARLLPGIAVAGKTGTSNAQRDSWFAGFTGNLVAVAWLGHDDNTPTALYGASGAMLVWASLMRTLPAQPVVLSPPAEIRWVAVNAGNGVPAAGCPGGYGVPVWGEPPPDTLPCAGSDDFPARAGEGARRAWRWLHELF